MEDMAYVKKNVDKQLFLFTFFYLLMYNNFRNDPHPQALPNHVIQVQRVQQSIPLVPYYQDNELKEYISSLEHKIQQIEQDFTSVRNDIEEDNPREQLLVKIETLEQMNSRQRLEIQLLKQERDQVESNYQRLKKEYEDSKLTLTPRVYDDGKDQLILSLQQKLITFQNQGNSRLINRDEIYEKERQIADLQKQILQFYVPNDRNDYKMLRLELEEKDRLIQQLQMQTFSLKQQPQSEKVIENLKIQINEKDVLLSQLQKQVSLGNQLDLKLEIEEKDRLVFRLQQQISQMKDSDGFILTLRKQIDEKDQQNMRLRNEIKELQQQLSKVQLPGSSMKNLSQQIEELQQLLSLQANENRKLQNSKLNIDENEEFRRMKKQLTVKSETIEDLEEQIAQLKQVKGQILQKDRQIQQLVFENQSLQQNIEELKQFLSLQVNENRKFQYSNKDIEENEEFRRMKKQLTVKSETIEDLEGQIVQLKQMKGEILQKDRQIQQLVLENQSLQQQNRKLDSQLKNQENYLFQNQNNQDIKNVELIQKLQDELRKIRNQLDYKEDEMNELLKRFKKLEVKADQAERMKLELDHLYEQKQQQFEKNSSQMVKQDEVEEWKLKQINDILILNRFQRAEQLIKDLKAKVTFYAQENHRLTQNNDTLEKKIIDSNLLKSKADSNFTAINQTSKEIDFWKQRLYQAESKFDTDIKLLQKQFDEKFGQMNDVIVSLQIQLESKNQELLADSAKISGLERRMASDLKSLECKLKMIIAEKDGFERQLQLERENNSLNIREMDSTLTNLARENELLKTQVREGRVKSKEIQIQGQFAKTEAENQFLKNLKEDLENQLKNQYEKVRIISQEKEDMQNIIRRYELGSDEELELLKKQLTELQTKNYELRSKQLDWDNGLVQSLKSQNQQLKQENEFQKKLLDEKGELIATYKKQITQLSNQILPLEKTTFSQFKKNSKSSEVFEPQLMNEQVGVRNDELNQRKSEVIQILEKPGSQLKQSNEPWQHQRTESDMYQHQMPSSMRSQDSKIQLFKQGLPPKAQPAFNKDLSTPQQKYPFKEHWINELKQTQSAKQSIELGNSDKNYFANPNQFQNVKPNEYSKQLNNLKTQSPGLFASFNPVVQGFQNFSMPETPPIFNNIIPKFKY